MSRSLTILLRRDPSRDRRDGEVHFEGYEFLWPDGRAMGVGLDAFCKHGLRLLGLGRRRDDSQQRLLEMICFPLRGLEDDLTRLPGARVRRFFVERAGPRGRLHFLDGTPTAVVFDLDRDEEAVLEWIGLPGLADGERLWLDLAARPAEPAEPAPPVPGSAHGPRG